METLETTYESGRYYAFSPFARNWVATPGVMQLCNDLKCYWFLDTLASYVMSLGKIKGLGYLLVVALTPSGYHGEMGFTIKDNDAVIITQRIQTTLETPIKLWAICSSSGDYTSEKRTVLLLPEEY